MPTITSWARKVFRNLRKPHIAVIDLQQKLEWAGLSILHAIFARSRLAAKPMEQVI